MPEEKPLEQRAQESPYKTTLKDLIPLWSFYQWHKARKQEKYTPKESFNVFTTLLVLEAVKCGAYTIGALGLYDWANR